MAPWLTIIIFLQFQLVLVSSIPNSNLPSLNESSSLSQMPMPQPATTRVVNSQSIAIGGSSLPSHQISLPQPTTTQALTKTEEESQISQPAATQAVDRTAEIFLLPFSSSQSTDIAIPGPSSSNNPERLVPFPSSSLQESQPQVITPTEVVMETPNSVIEDIFLEPVQSSVTSPSITELSSEPTLSSNGDITNLLSDSLSIPSPSRRSIVPTGSSQISSIPIVNDDVTISMDGSLEVIPFPFQTVDSSFQSSILFGLSQPIEDQVMLTSTIAMNTASVVDSIASPLLILSSPSPSSQMPPLPESTQVATSSRFVTSRVQRLLESSLSSPTELTTSRSSQGINSLSMELSLSQNQPQLSTESPSVISSVITTNLERSLSITSSITETIQKGITSTVTMEIEGRTSSLEFPSLTGASLSDQIPLVQSTTTTDEVGEKSSSIEPSITGGPSFSLPQATVTITGTTAPIIPDPSSSSPATTSMGTTGTASLPDPSPSSPATTSVGTTGTASSPDPSPSSPATTSVGTMGTASSPDPSPSSPATTSVGTTGTASSPDPSPSSPVDTTGTVSSPVQSPNLSPTPLLLSSLLQSALTQGAILTNLPTSGMGSSSIKLSQTPSQHLPRPSATSAITTITTTILSSSNKDVSSFPVPSSIQPLSSPVPVEPTVDMMVLVSSIPNSNLPSLNESSSLSQMPMPQPATTRVVNSQSIAIGGSSLPSHQISLPQPTTTQALTKTEEESQISQPAATQAVDRTAEIFLLPFSSSQSTDIAIPGPSSSNNPERLVPFPSSILQESQPQVITPTEVVMETPNSVIEDIFLEPVQSSVTFPSITELSSEPTQRVSSNGDITNLLSDSLSIPSPSRRSIVPTGSSQISSIPIVNDDVTISMDGSLEVIPFPFQTVDSSFQSSILFGLSQPIEDQVMLTSTIAMNTASVVDSIASPLLILSSPSPSNQMPPLPESTQVATSSRFVTSRVQRLFESSLSSPTELPTSRSSQGINSLSMELSLSQNQPQLSTESPSIISSIITTTLERSLSITSSITETIQKGITSTVTMEMEGHTSSLESPSLTRASLSDQIPLVQSTTTTDVTTEVGEKSSSIEPSITGGPSFNQTSLPQATVTITGTTAPIVPDPSPSSPATTSVGTTGTVSSPDPSPSSPATMGTLSQDSVSPDPSPISPATTSVGTTGTVSSPDPSPSSPATTSVGTMGTASSPDPSPSSPVDTTGIVSSPVQSPNLSPTPILLSSLLQSTLTQGAISTNLPTSGMGSSSIELSQTPSQHLPRPSATSAITTITTTILSSSNKDVSSFPVPSSIQPLSSPVPVEPTVDMRPLPPLDCRPNMIPSPCGEQFPGCMPSSYICDLQFHCSNGRDEMFCDGRGGGFCPPTSTPCRRDTSRCIDNRDVCDGFNHCFDSSDEEFCDDDACPPGMVATPCQEDFPDCISDGFICDGVSQCSGGEDEFLCEEEVINSCPSQSTPCRSDVELCVSSLLICNGVMDDCPGNMDELFCGEFSCPQGSVLSPCQSDHPGCIMEERLCNLISDCTDMSDESTEESQCSESNFFPFGQKIGDVTLPVRLNNPIGPVRLPYPVVYFQIEETSLFISANGLLSFRDGFNRFEPSSFPQSRSPVVPIIAPFWSDLSFMNAGNVFLRFSGVGDVEHVLDILNNKSDIFNSYTPTFIGVVTWFRASIFGESNMVTFQAVLSTDGEMSFVSFIYSEIDFFVNEVERQVGFDAGDKNKSASILNIGLNSKPDFFEEITTFRIDGNCITVVSEEPDSCGIDFIAVACRPMSFTASLCKCRAAGFQPFEGSCIDTNECDSGPCASNALCVNTIGSFECICNKTGFAMVQDRCEDVDECNTAIQNLKNRCDQICINTLGGYNCSCNQGYQLADDKYQCEDIDECITNNTCGPNSQCENTLGSFRCDCNRLHMQVGDTNYCQTESYIIVVSGTLSGLLFVIAAIIVGIIICCVRARRKLRKYRTQTADINLTETSGDREGNQYFQNLRNITVNSSFKLQVPKSLVIASCNLQIGNTIGQGEFGIVYKGLLKKGFSESYTETVAVKTLKGFLEKELVKDLLKECAKMQEFNHPNVLKLRGVCLDGGPAPYIIMPFMSNGSLLSHLKQERERLSPEEGSDSLSGVQNKLLDMCFQVAKGMEYLTNKKVIHRDLAARNCMIDVNFVIKVADFGLSESIDSSKDYFRQDQDNTIKLPVKWMAPESMLDGIFSEKTDVWSYGVTCWEVFSGGKTPYPGIHPLELSRQLETGYRMEKPLNAACPEEMYAIMMICWDCRSDLRPSFSQLVRRISSLLESMADYIDFLTISNHFSLEATPPSSATASSAPASVLRHEVDTFL